MKKKNHFILVILTVMMILPYVALSQSTINGNVKDNKGEPLPYASVLLLNPTDSSLVKGEITDIDGLFAIKNVNDMEYIVSVTMVGYASHYSSPLNVSSENTTEIGTITLLDNTTDLGEVNVVAKRSLFEQKIDRMVVNVGSSVTSAGSNALEVLERSPGVIVDRLNGSVSMAGKNGVVVMIKLVECRVML